MDFIFDLQMFSSTIDPTYKFQLKWGEETWGLLEVKPTPVKTVDGTTYKISATINEQTSASTMTAPKTGLKYYFKTHNVFASVAKTNTVEFMFVSVDTEGNMEDLTNQLTTNSTITLNAPTTQPIIADVKNVAPVFTINKVAAGSTLNLGAGDKATTGTLKANEVIHSVNPTTNETLDYKTAGGILTFVGQTVVLDNSTEVTGTALQSGTVILQQTTDETTGDPIRGIAYLPNKSVIDTTDTDGVTVKVANGKLTSVTGLNGLNAEVYYSETVNGVTTETYFKALNAAGTMIEKRVSKQTATGVNTTTTYLDLAKAGGEIFKGAYKNAVSYDTGKLNTLGTNVKYFHLAAVDTAVAGTGAIDTWNPDGTAEARSITAGKFVANAGGYYLKVSSKTTAATTTAPITTQITGVELVQSNAAGQLTVVKDKAYTGTFTFDAEDYAVKYTKPATAKFHVAITNADVRSTFTGLSTGDSITSKTGEYAALVKGNYAVYAGGITPVSHINVTTGSVTANVANDGTVDSVTNFSASGEKVTVINTDATTGTETREFVATANGKATITITSAEGVRSVYTGVTVTDADNMMSFDKTALDTLVADETSGVKVTESIVADFDWTLSKSKVGYFAVTGTQENAAATVKAGVTTIKSNAPAKTYIKVAVDGTGAFTITPVTMTGIDETASAPFIGKLTINAPATAIKYETLDPNLTDGEKTATLTFNNVAAGSSFTSAVLGKNGKVTTAKLAKGDKIHVDVDYIAGTNSDTLVINSAGLFSGTVWSYDQTNAITVGNYTITNETGTADVTKLDETCFTVTAASGKTFKVGALHDGDTFKVVDNKGTADDTSDDVDTTFTKFGSYLYADDNGTKKMYSLKGNSIDSAALDSSKPAWKEAIDLNDLTVKGSSIVNLSAADKALAADENAALTFVRDRYVVTAPTEKSSFTATAVKAGTSDATYMINLGTTNAKKEYKGADNTEQVINVTNGWTVTAGDDAITTFNGAASGEDTLEGGDGADTFALSNAADTIIDAIKGKDEVKNYASGKDKLVLGGGTADAPATINFDLSKTTANDVYVLDAANTDGYDDADTDYVLLKGVGGKAVSISTDGGKNYNTYYFGNGKLNAYAKNDADKFTFVDKAYYVGNNSGANTLTVGTLSNYNGKTTKGDALDINLNNDPKYTNINIVDATASNNEVALTAKDADTADTKNTGSTLKGGSYISTLTGGSGNDTLVGGTGKDTFVMSAGQDTIQKYTSGQDVIMTRDNVDIANFHAIKGNVVIDADLTDPDTDSVVIEGAAGKAISIVKREGDPDYNVDVAEDDPLYHPNQYIDTKYKVYVGESKKNNTFTYEAEAGVTPMYVGNDDAGYTDKLNVATTIKELTPVELTETQQDELAGIAAGQFPYTDVIVMPKYQGGSLDLSSNNGNIKSIEEVDASGVKATAAALSEYGSKYIKKYAGVHVKAVDADDTDGEGTKAGTTFTGSAYDDLFECGAGKDVINYTANQGNDIVNGINVGDTIKLYGLTKEEIQSVADSINNATGKAVTFSKGGSLTFSGVTPDSVTATVSGSTISVKAHA